MSDRQTAQDALQRVEWDEVAPESTRAESGPYGPSDAGIRTAEIVELSDLWRVIAYNGKRRAWMADFVDKRAAWRAADRWRGITRNDFERLFARTVDTEELPF